MSAQIQGHCWHCGAALGSQDFGRETNCLSCGKPTRVCRNCRWFSSAATNQCREPMAERVLEKERANYCEFFEATLEPAAAGGDSEAAALQQTAEALFKL